MEGEWRVSGGWVEGGWRVGGGWVEGGWRVGGGWVEGGWRVGGGWVEGGWVGEGKRRGRKFDNGGIILYNCADLQKSVIAGVAQLVERNLAKVEVAGSNPVSRSTGFGRFKFWEIQKFSLRRSVLEPN